MLWLIAGLVALLAALWLWWWWPKRRVDRLKLTIRDPKARADVEDNFRKTIGQLLGAAMVLVGAGGAATVAYLQLSSQQQAAHELLISNQVAKGFEQLGSDKDVVRLGGIYALEGVMNISEQYHQPVLEALSAFVRDSTRAATGDGPPATDVQAALTVIGRRKAIGTGNPNLITSGGLYPGPWPVALNQPNLAHANIPKADLNGADLSGADLTGANLSSANLSAGSLIHIAPPTGGRSSALAIRPT
jgi:Pentapeptide repeats (8 copies)